MSAELVAIAAIVAVAARLLAAAHDGPRSLPWTAAAIAAVVALVYLRRDDLTRAQSAREALRAEVPHLDRDGGYVSSDACRACHPGEYHSWHRSWHRTMTQLATPEAVVAPFDGVQLAALGRTYALSRDGDEFRVDMPDLHAERDLARRGAANQAPPRRTARVVMTTGSHYMQTYWVEAPGTREVFNLPWVYDFERAAWLPRESVFLRDPKAGPFKQVWNDNCIQCHSTGPQPRMLKGGGADTRVGELGIACEACHGPGAAHVEANRGLVARYLNHLGGAPDPTIVNPARLDPLRASQVCGQCHSKSLIADPKAWYAGDGLAYRPGDDLTRTRAPILPRSDPNHPALVWSVKSDPGFVERFFWRDGMIRVSGREYNGLVESRCHKDGALSCLSCHTMHGDDPDMQPRPGMRGPAACVQCHGEYVGEALTKHTHHAADSSGSDCLNCHMPYTTYGLLRGLRSHLIDSPTIAATLDVGRPNACNACHLDRTLAWADDKLHAWYGAPSLADRMTADDRTVAAAVLWMLRGDAGQRALAAWYAGWAPARAAAGDDWPAAHLTELLTDPYDAVRHIAARSLRALPGFAALDYDFVAPPAAREQARDRARAAFPGAAPAPSVLIGADGRPDRRAIDALLSARDDRVVDLLE